MSRFSEKRWVIPRHLERDVPPLSEVEALIEERPAGVGYPIVLLDESNAEPVLAGDDSDAIAPCRCSSGVADFVSGPWSTSCISASFER